MKKFAVKKFYTYIGPNFYLDRRALVFNLELDPEEVLPERFATSVLGALPEFEGKIPETGVDLFCAALTRVLKMGIDLFLERIQISRDGTESVIAIEYLDDRITRDGAHLISEWFQAIEEQLDFDFKARFIELQEDFDATLFGGPTLYSLIEAGLIRNIPVLYHDDENQFQWGYGSKHVRGRSTTFHVDSIKDTEFTAFKDMCKDFLLVRGFPTPTGRNTFTREECVLHAEALGFPVVVKPVAGHKGQGVVTNIETIAGVTRAFDNIIAAAAAEGVGFDGALVEQQVYGTDHRLLAVGGKFAAALERVPAYVIGDGTRTIEELISIENDTVERLDNARSPLCKIHIDDDLEDYLRLQSLTVASVPENGVRVELRRVANISQGGVSINVTEKIHPDNIQLVENIARFLNVTCLGIDALAKDISKSWRDGDFGIIEINAGPGVFMHLAPAIGGSVDVPGIIMRTHFPEGSSGRIPIIAGNNLSQNFCDAIRARVHELNPASEVGDLTQDGIRFNGAFLCKNEHHDENVRIMLRNPKLDFALFNHSKDDVLDYGTVHEGADIVILDEAGEFDGVLARDVVDGGVLIIKEGSTVTIKEGKEERTVNLNEDEDLDDVFIGIVSPLIDKLLHQYS